MADELLEELLGIERAGWDALCAGVGADFYGDLMTSDGVMVLAHGQAMTRSEATAVLRGSPAWHEYVLDDVRLVTTGADSAEIVYRGTARRAGADPFVGLMTSVYVRVTGRWRLALYTQTPVPAK